MYILRSSTDVLLENPATLATEIKMIGLRELLTKSSPGDQIICIDILSRLMATLEKEVAEELVSLVAELVTSNYPEVKKAALTLVGDQYSGGRLTEEGKRNCLAALLTGLRDTDLEVQQQVRFYISPVQF